MKSKAWTSIWRAFYLATISKWGWKAHGPLQEDLSLMLFFFKGWYVKPCGGECYFSYSWKLVYQDTPVLEKARSWNHGIFGVEFFQGLGKPLGPCSLSVCKCMERRRVEKTSIKSPWWASLCYLLLPKTIGPLVKVMDESLPQHDLLVEDIPFGVSIIFRFHAETYWGMIFVKAQHW